MREKDALNVYLMRHGETDWNKDRRCQGKSDIPLNDYGRKLAKITKKAMEEEGISFDFCYASPLVRAYETAQIVLEGMDVTPVTDERLKEISFGDCEGLAIPMMRQNPSKYAAFLKCFTDPENYVPMGDGETFTDLTGRLSDFVGEKILPLEGQYENVLVACHGAVVRGIICVMRNIPIRDFWDSIQMNCAVSCLSLENGKFDIIYEGRIFYEAEHEYLDPSTGKMIRDGKRH